MWLDHVLNVLKDFEYGTVPAWISTGSIVLAYRVFRRDHRSSQRHQIDQVGVWLEVAGEVQQGTKPADKVQVKYFVRNGSDLPVEVAQIAYEMTTSWTVPGAKAEEYHPMPGKTPVRQFYLPWNQVRPDYTFSNESQPFEISVADVAPKPGASLDSMGGVAYSIRWVLLSDAAGRRWRIEPGRRTKRVRWYSWRDGEYPATWKHFQQRDLKHLPPTAREILARRKRAK